MKTLLVILYGGTFITTETMNVKKSQKFCGFPGICNLSYSFTLNDVHMASEGRCCKSDHCNINIPQVASRNLTKNGLKCPFCLQEGKGGCTPKNQTLCTGLEVMCIKFSGYLRLGEAWNTISFQGCATPSACPDAPSMPNPESKISISCAKGFHHFSEEDDNSLPVIS
ncbi:phospholipase A2 inhibitor and Ly6/PLAUR domain-containing protein-like isoform X2 [Phyllobates terribilis]|uniref:phospholipase A2 inhibitor and Ly6/PLAUR domain-containing protein-like isoform X2 n=1 Tax=Phyllobates terribilis TaxID=111132 RepID=UPI003CCB6F32